MKKVLTGNEAAAEGAALAQPQVVAAYPITPATQIGEALAAMEASGRYKGKLLRVESEHAAMAALLGAASAGARTFTATSSQGLAYMHEMLHWISGARLPVVMAEVNRALAAPWNLWSDQTDSLSQRDTGWMQFYCATNQEVLDTVLMAYKISEAVELPAMIVLDGFLLSHAYEPVDVPDQAAVEAFLPPYAARERLDCAEPAAFGAMLPPRDYMVHRRHLADDLERALEVHEQVAAEFEARFARRWGLLEPYRLEDAKVVLVSAGAVSGMAKAAVDELRREGHAAGALRLRSFRPFPTAQLRRLVSPDMTLAVVDRAFTTGTQGIFAQELRAAFAPLERRPAIAGFVAGLGGAEVNTPLLKEIWREAAAGAAKDELVWMEAAR